MILYDERHMIESTHQFTKHCMYYWLFPGVTLVECYFFTVIYKDHVKYYDFISYRNSPQYIRTRG